MSRIPLAALALALAPATALADEPAPAPPAVDPAQPQPYPQPYPPQPYPPQPYPPQPYPPYGYYPPQPLPPSGPPPEDNSGKIALIGDFAALGILSTVTLMVYRDYDDPGTGTLLVMGGALGGAGLGWIIGDKMDATRADGNAATMGMVLGLANAGLLLVPTNQTDSGSEVLGTLLLGGTAGITGGLMLARTLDLTQGQSTFAANLALLGIGTSLIVSALIDQDDGDVDAAEMLSLAVGLDGGAAAGLAIAPKIQWSPRRARFVLAASAVGTFLGGMIGGLLATDKNQETGETTTDPDLTAGSLLVGMWGGFAGGIALSNDWAPDPRFHQVAPAAPPPGGITTLPMVGQDRVGVMATGTF